MGPKSVASEEEIIRGIDKVSKHLEIERLWEGILAGNDRRIARQRHQDEVSLGRDQLEQWFKANVLAHEITIDSSRANDVKWTRNNSIFADVILRADTPSEAPSAQNPSPQMDGIPIGPSPSAPAPPPRSSLLIPCHRAMLIRSEYFSTMFSSSFLEAQETPYLQIVSVDVSPAVLQVILTFLYTEKVDFPLELAIDVLFAADMLFIEKLKTKAAILISSLGMGSSSALVDRTHAQDHGGVDDKAELINIYDVIRAAWMTRVQRLEEFAARYLAYRLEEYVDDEEFEELILESAARVENRQETDTIELLDEYVFIPFLLRSFPQCFMVIGD
jgi:ankyrin repeat/BTB/POZ domain-containing protein 1